MPSDRAFPFKVSHYSCLPAGTPVFRCRHTSEDKIRQDKTRQAKPSQAKPSQTEPSQAKTRITNATDPIYIASAGKVLSWNCAVYIANATDPIYMANATDPIYIANAMDPTPVVDN